MSDRQAGTLDATDLMGRVAKFVAHLRLNDFALGPAETIAALDVAQHVDVCAPGQLRAAFRSLLSSRKSEWDRFDELFEAFWFGRGAIRSRPSQRNEYSSSSARSKLWQNHLQGPMDTKTRLPQEIDGEGGERETEKGDSRVAASEQASIAQTDLRRIVDPVELAEAEYLAGRLARAMRYRLSRRVRVSKRRRRLDLRRSIRRSISKGGEPFDLVWRRRPDRPVRIVVLLDVSGSMQQYSRFFLQFVKGLVGAWSESDAYVFHTRLVRVTDALAERDPMRAMAKVTLISGGFGGGTKIGSCLRAFNNHYAKSTLNSRSVVILLSDGYDTADPSELVMQLKRLRRKSRRIIWLNPLLGWQGYEPISRAMSAALPHVDAFASAHSLEALAALEAEFASL